MKFNKTKIIRISLVLVLGFILLGVTSSFAMQHYYKVDFSTGLVTATNLNVRSGPGIQYKVVTSVKQNELVLEIHYTA